MSTESNHTGRFPDEDGIQVCHDEAPGKISERRGEENALPPICTRKENPGRNLRNFFLEEMDRSKPKYMWEQRKAQRGRDGCEKDTSEGRTASFQNERTAVAIGTL